jgi:hypothetical protein
VPIFYLCSSQNLINTKTPLQQPIYSDGRTLPDLRRLSGAKRKIQSKIITLQAKIPCHPPPLSFLIISRVQQLSFLWRPKQVQVQNSFSHEFSTCVSWCAVGLYKVWWPISHSHIKTTPFIKKVASSLFVHYSQSG